MDRKTQIMEMKLVQRYCTHKLQQERKVQYNNNEDRD